MSTLPGKSERIAREMSAWFTPETVPGAVVFDTGREEAEP